MMEIEIKTGKRKHLTEVLELIKELAVYEREPDAVIVTLEEMEKDGFGNQKIFDFFVAETEGKVVGIAIYYMRYSTWEGKCIYLEDLIVKEEYRGNGIGALLFEKLITKSKELNVQRMEWQVLNWNEPAINFYKKYNANLDEEWINGKLVYDQIQKFR